MKNIDAFFTTTFLISLLMTMVGSLTAQQEVREEGLVGMKFPKMKIEALSGVDVVYPDSLSGNVRLVFVAFEREAQDIIDTWMEPFSERYEDSGDVSFYEIPMLKGRWKLISRYIDGGMRSGIPVERHGNVSTFYGNIDKYRRILGMDDKSDAYLFLLDGDGVIRWYDRGWATDEKLAMLYANTEMLRLVAGIEIRDDAAFRGLR